MNFKLQIILLVMVVFVGTLSFAADASKPATTPQFNMENVAKIKVGTTTGPEILALLGQPYRMTNYGDCNPIDYQEFWEYAAKEGDGWVRIHIEFDEDHIARVITKAPPNGHIEVLAIAEKPQHRHEASVHEHR